MKKRNIGPHKEKLHRTYFKTLFSYAAMYGAVIFLISTGIARELLTWNQSVFISAVIMFFIMAFYFKNTLRRAHLISLEKDTLDLVKKQFNGQETEKLSARRKLLFDTDNFFEDNSQNSEFVGTFVADYFRNLGKRISTVHSLTDDPKQVASINTDELIFCFYADMERLIKPMVNAGRKLLLFGFLGTVIGILLIGIGMRFGETAQQTLLIAKELIAGLGVAAMTTILGIIGNLILSSFYEQQEDIRDRIIAELTRITSIYGLDLCQPENDCEINLEKEGPENE